MAPAGTRVAVVVDHRAVRAWLCAIVERHRDLALCGSAGTLEEAEVLVARQRPHVVILDDRLGGVPAVVACRRLRAADPPPEVLFLSSLEDEDAVVNRLLSGAAGAVLRGDHDDDVAARVLAVAHLATDATAAAASPGRVLLQGRLARGSPAGAAPGAARLLGLITEGRTDGEIARTLGLTRAEVEHGVLDLLARLHLDGSTSRTPSPSVSGHVRR